MVSSYSSKDDTTIMKSPISVVKATSISAKSPAKSAGHQSTSKSASTTSSTSVTVSVKRKADTPTTGTTKRVRKDKEQGNEWR